MLDAQWLQKDYILVHVLMVSPRDARKMTILWNSAVVFLQGGVGRRTRDTFVIECVTWQPGCSGLRGE